MTTHTWQGSFNREGSGYERREKTVVGYNIMIARMAYREIDGALNLGPYYKSSRGCKLQLDNQGKKV